MSETACSKCPTQHFRTTNRGHKVRGLDLGQFCTYTNLSVYLDSCQAAWARIKCFKMRNQELRGKKKSPPRIRTEASQANIYASSRNWISHSSAASLPTQSGVLSWKQTGSSSNSTLADMAPSAEKPNKTGFSRNRGSLPGVGRLSLKG